MNWVVMMEFLKSFLRNLYNARMALAHLQENSEQLRFAKDHFEGERLDKLLQSRKRLIIIQIIPWPLFLVFIIGTLLFVPNNEVTHNCVWSRDLVLLAGVVLFVPFLFIWLILSQFIGGGRLWVRYAKWLRGHERIEKINKIIDSYGN